MIAWTATDVRNIWNFVERLRLHGQEVNEFFGDVMPNWEKRLIASVLGLPGAEGREKHLMEVCATVGMGKDQVMGICLLVLMRFAPPGTRIVVWSTKLEKSREVKEAAEGFVIRDEHLGLRSDVVFIKGEMKCAREVNAFFCSMDKNSATGTFYDYAFMNEVQDWEGRAGQDVYDHTMIRVNKRDGKFVCFTNAPHDPPDGSETSWRRQRWDEARRHGSDWHYVEITADQCKWIDKKHIAMLRRNQPEEKIQRLYWCKATDGTYDLVSPELISAAEREDLVLAQEPKRIGKRFLGVDLGVKRDHAVICLLCIVPTEEVFLERLDVWNPAHSGGEVDLDEVEAKAMYYGKVWRAEVLPDPWNARQMIQHLTRAGVRVREVQAIPANQNKIARSIISLFFDRRIRVPKDCGKTLIGHRSGRDEFTSLKSQLLGADVEDRASGIRLAVERTKFGHGDQLMAFGLAAFGLVDSGYGATAASVPSRPTDQPQQRGIERRSCAGAALRAKHGAGLPERIGAGLTRETWRRFR